MTRKLKISLYIGVIVFISATIWTGCVAYRTLIAPLNPTAQILSVKIPPGASLAEIAKRLYEKQFISHPNIFIWIARIRGVAEKLRYGEYEIKPGMSLIELMENMVNAKGIVMHQVMFIEGWTFEEIKKALNKDDNLRHKIKGKTNAQIMALLGLPIQHSEGLFFPDTYTFAWGTSDLEVLKTAYALMQQTLSKLWQTRAANLPYETPYQALIVASLVEKETAIKNERPLVAGVILRRLQKGMRLQVDPTVLYGLNKPFGSVITRKDLKSKTPYNTYVIRGLPPTPIDIPSFTSIEAALHPMQSDALYYVARGDGSHQFSATYKEHLQAVKKYRQQEVQSSQDQHSMVEPRNIVKWALHQLQLLHLL